MENWRAPAGLNFGQDLLHKANIPTSSFFSFWPSEKGTSVRKLDTIMPTMSKEPGDLPAISNIADDTNNSDSSSDDELLAHPPDARNAPLPRLQEPSPLPMGQQQQPLVPRMFPGVKRIMISSMEPFLVVIFNLMRLHRPHVEIGSQNKRAGNQWKRVYDNFFDRTSGPGRNFQLWTSDNPWRKFRTSVMSAVNGYNQIYCDRSSHGDQTGVIDSLAHDIYLQTLRAKEAYDQALQNRAENDADRQRRLHAAEQRMGLLPPGAGTSAPSIGFALTSHQQEALNILGQNPNSPGRNITANVSHEYDDDEQEAFGDLDPPPDPVLHPDLPTAGGPAPPAAQDQPAARGSAAAAASTDA